jgi:hypothetical protein
MDFDYDREEKDFLDVLESNKYKTERITNTGPGYKELGERDLTAFDDYLESNSFATFAKVASK